MTIKANGRSALMLAAGLLVCFAGSSSQAAPASADNTAASSKSETAAGAPIALNKYTKHASRHGKSDAKNEAKNDAPRKSSKEAQKSSAGKKADDVAADADNTSTSSAMPPSVANANAELAAGDTPTAANVKAMSARASDILQTAPDSQASTKPGAETQIVAADQLNDVDRALHENTAPAPAMASAEPPAAAAPQPAPVMATASTGSSTLDQTSLIGKIFIGFGALLTMASAARMFMA